MSGRFVVGTGRCGSTLLDRMLAAHPDVLVLSEFFAAVDRGRLFSSDAMTGPEFADTLCRGAPYTEMLRARGLLDDDRVHDRWGRTGTPAPLLVTLPTLGGGSVELFEELLVMARRRPREPVGRHLEAAFDWLAERFGKAMWIERSGASLQYAGDLRRLFPGARFVHIHRGGPESALSMRDHPFFTLFVSYEHDPPSGEELEVTVAGPQQGETDPLARRLERKPPVERFGESWTRAVMEGMRALRGLDARSYLEIRYEDLVVSTAPVLDRVTSFFGIAAVDSWVEEVQQLVEPVPGRASDLGAAERDALARACRPAQVLLGQVDEPGLEPVWAAMRRLMEHGGR